MKLMIELFDIDFIMYYSPSNCGYGMYREKFQSINVSRLLS